MNNLQKIIAAGTLVGLSLFAGCRDTSKERAKVEMDAVRAQRMVELKCGIYRKDSPARELVLKHAHYVLDYNDPVSKKSGKIAIYGDDTSQDWQVVYMPDN